MAHNTVPYPLETVVRIKKTGQFAIIKHVVFLKDGKSFLHYEGPIDGKPEGNYAFYHEEIELEVLPKE